MALLSFTVTVSSHRWHGSVSNSPLAHSLGPALIGQGEWG
jgi:hypothetical protein